MAELLLKEEVYRIVGAAMEVYNILGPGFLEPVYHEALEIELGLREIPFRSHEDLRIEYKGRELRKTYEADFIVFEKIIVEVKALSELTSVDDAQLLNYLKATGLQVGVLINFGNKNQLEWSRKVWTAKK